MSKTPAPRAVDEQIKNNLREPEHFAFAGTRPIGATDLGLPDEEGPASDLFRMSDAALAGRHTFYEREGIFARDHGDREDAKAEMARTAREIHRRKIVKRNEANKAFAGPAVTDMEAGYDQERMAA